jgi:hypothetical protein
VYTAYYVNRVSTPDKRVSQRIAEAISVSRSIAPDDRSTDWENSKSDASYEAALGQPMELR